MRTLIPTLPLVLGALFILTAAPRAWAADMPSTRAVQAEQSEPQCAELTKHPAIIRRQNKAWKTPIDASGEAALRVWDTTCRDYQQRHHLWEPDSNEKANAWSAAAWERSERRFRSRIDCVSTWHHSPYSSRLTTTCTGN